MTTSTIASRTCTKCAYTYDHALPTGVCEACTGHTDPDRKPDSLHFWDCETGNADDHVSVLLSLAHVDPFTEAGLYYTAMSITAAWCWECHDTGVLGETWGPAEGCREYMTEPETWYCQCIAGYEAKEDAARRFAEATDWDEV